MERSAPTVAPAPERATARPGGGVLCARMSERAVLVISVVVGVVIGIALGIQLARWSGPCPHGWYERDMPNATICANPRLLDHTR